MTFARVRAPGLWIDGTTVPGTQWEQFDANLANALDGADGGTYSLASDMTIGGDPFVAWIFDLETSFNAFSIFTANVTFGDDVQFLASATFDAAATFNDPVSFTDDVTFGDPVIFNDVVTFNDPVTFADNAGFQGAAFFDGNVNIGSSTADVATFDATCDFSGPVTVQNAADFEGNVTTSSVGNFRVRRVRRQTIGVDADATIDVTLTDHVIMPSGVLTTTRNHTISDTGAMNGDRVRFTNFDSTQALVVKRPGGATIGTLQNAAGVIMSLDAERIAGVWYSVPFAIPV